MKKYKVTYYKKINYSEPVEKEVEATGFRTAVDSGIMLVTFYQGTGSSKEDLFVFYNGVSVEKID